LFSDTIINRCNLKSTRKQELTAGGKTMKYVCDVCGWVYDEEEGAEDFCIAPGTKWEDLPEDFECPLCGVGKSDFTQE
jgi:rubredoxin-NAD+ reductase